MKLFYIALLIPGLISAKSEEYNPFKTAQKWIDEINNDPYSTWKAGQNFNPNLPASYIKRLFGAIIEDSSKLEKRDSFYYANDIEIPEEFDSRKQWPNCKALQTIRDQGNCGSCWAVSTASAFTDRLCIASKGQFNSQLSSYQLLACCRECGYGCNGGSPANAWVYFYLNGIVTGGDYDSKEGCQPYPLEQCEHHIVGPRPNCSSLPSIEPECKDHCTNEAYKTPFSEDNHKVSEAYRLSQDVIVIQKEIIEHGPVAAAFTVYEDFIYYKTGVYEPHTEKKLSGHAVKIIGWGVEKETPYWLIQNSWNSDWGDQGLFKIRRGNNTCGIEQYVTAGIPVV